MTKEEIFKEFNEQVALKRDSLKKTDCPDGYAFEEYNEGWRSAFMFATDILAEIIASEQEPKKGLHSNSLRKVDNPMAWIEEDEAERNTPKIKGWVARENPKTNKALYFFTKKPQRKIDIFGVGYWACGEGNKFRIPQDIFPEMGWEDNPRECELGIKLL